MKVSELKKRLSDLPDNMEVVITNGWDTNRIAGYSKIAKKVRKAKPKLTREYYHGAVVVQERPKKDPEATIAFVIEG